MKELIEFSKFMEIEKSLEISIGKVVEVKEVPKADKLLQLTVDFGNESRTVVTNIKPDLEDANELNGKSFPFVMNLKPVTMMGVESTAMIMPGDLKNGNMVTCNGKLGVKLL